jgi:hypothetical protein
MNYSRNNKILNIKPMLLLFLAMVLSIFVEWKTLTTSIQPYLRLSVVFASVLLLVFFINFNVDGGKIIKTLSEMTLGVILLHIFIRDYYSAIFPGLAVYTSINVPLNYGVIVVMSFILTYCIKKLNIV